LPISARSAVPTLPVPPAELFLALVLAFVGSLLQGSIGFGLSVVAAPILLLVDPRFVPGPMMLAAVFLVILIAMRERRDVIVRDVGLATIGRIIGTLPAAYALTILPARTYELLFAVLILLAVTLSAFGWHIRRTPINVVLAAILSGFIGTISSVGGPAMALMYQHETGPKVRGTISAIFTIGTTISVAALWWIGRFGVLELTLGLLLLPGVLLGFLLSQHTARRLDKAHIRPAVLALSALSAIVIALRAVW
jgi:uncharacterized membrane protein YfcA